MSLYKIGNAVVSIDDIPKHHCLDHLFIDMVDVGTSIDLTLEIDIVDEPCWEPHAPMDENDVFSAAAPPLLIVYRKDTHTLSVKMTDVDRVNEHFWFRRMFFGAMGSICGPLLFHAASVIMDNGAYIFAADSGGGKSTLINTIKPFVEIVNGETAWVVDNSGGDRYLVNQNYYMGTSDKLYIPIHQIYLIKISEECKSIPLPSKYDAIIDLISVQPPFNEFDPFLEERSKRIWELVDCDSIRLLYKNMDATALISVLRSDNE